jgi:membrane-associated phospholipid phosphatase
MKKKLSMGIAAMLFIHLTEFAQQKDTLANKYGNINRRPDSTEKQSNSASNYETTNITFNNYFSLLGSNMKQEFSKPFNMTGKDWRNFGKFALAFGALGFADEPLQKYAAKLVYNNPAVKTISSYVTKFGGGYERSTLAIFAAYGLIFKNPKLVNTTLLATQAYIAGSAIEIVLKLVSGRTRPNYYTANEEAEPKFLGPFTKLGRDSTGKKRYSSFPSGHAIIAFGAATVFCQEYKDIKYLPVIAYSAATLVGLSRITENRHWITDVLTGAAIGYLNGENVVNNYHRYSKLKKSQQNKNTISYSFQYFNKQIIPGIIYSFK